MTIERERMLRTAPPRESNVGGRNTYWFQECPKHGKQAHLSYLGEACEKCQGERLSEPHRVSEPFTDSEIAASDNRVIREAYLRG
jgi:hypothetical protein